MRLATYRGASGPRLGVVRGEQIIDVAALEGFANTPEMLSLIDQGEPALARLRDALSAASDERLRQAGALHARPPTCWCNSEPLQPSSAASGPELASRLPSVLPQNQHRATHRY